jgi:hypothetical protein
LPFSLSTITLLGVIVQWGALEGGMVSDLSNDQPGDFATALAEEASIDRPDVSFDDL